MSDISDDEDISSVEETNPIEKPKAKKGRKPMSDEQKEAFKERMKKAREAKKVKPKEETKKLDMNSKGYKLAEKKYTEEWNRREEEDERATKARRERREKELEIDIKRKKEKEAREEELRNRPVVNNYYYGTEKAEPKAEAKPKKERKPRAKKEVPEPKTEPPKLKEMVFA